MVWYGKDEDDSGPCVNPPARLGGYDAGYADGTAAIGPALMATRAELDRVKAERDALLAAYIGRLPCGDLMPGEWRWTANLPHHRVLSNGGIVADTRWDSFDTREAAESAILAAARAAAEQREGGRVMLTIIVRQRSDDFHAHFEGCPGQWGRGATIVEAIGDLVWTHASAVDMRVVLDIPGAVQPFVGGKESTDGEA